MVMNVNGSSLGNPGPAGFGGLLRSGDGEWRLGFYGSIGVADNLEAELAALCFGLTIAWDEGIRRLTCYSDSQTTILLRTTPVSVTHVYAALAWTIQELLARDWEVTLLHTLREANASADVLAKMGASQRERLQIITAPPAAMGTYLQADAMRVVFLRD